MARRAYGACVNTVGTTFVCSGAETAQQTITLDDANVLTVPGFSVITADPRAVSITGDGASPIPTLMLRPSRRRLPRSTSAPTAIMA